MFPCVDTERDTERAGEVDTERAGEVDTERAGERASERKKEREREREREAGRVIEGHEESIPMRARARDLRRMCHHWRGGPNATSRPLRCALCKVARHRAHSEPST